jgi:hypothetical protein
VIAKLLRFHVPGRHVLLCQETNDEDIYMTKDIVKDRRISRCLILVGLLALLTILACANVGPFHRHCVWPLSMQPHAAIGSVQL